jgi:putative PIN family toxin of toxin-antitoxin system
VPVRAILDTNVLISALISPMGTPARLLVAAEKGSYELIVSDRLLGEMEDVLRREKFRRYVTPRNVTDYLLRLRLASTRAKEGEVFPVSSDAKDDYLFALALASGADFLVSGDGHLLDMPPVLTPVPVLTPSDFEATLQGR